MLMIKDNNNKENQESIMGSDLFASIEEDMS